jgi:alkaline phosphatase D
MRDIPTVCLPDDHDVYHGNVWGSAGKKAVLDPKDPETAISPVQSWQDSGGFKMPAEWVNIVQRTQTSHLPDPFDPTPVEQGISVYYTSLLYGGISFAIIEDRKWKSAPRHTIPWADIRNGWAQNPKYGPRDGDVPGAQLLGPRQMDFLEKWAQDWTGAFAKIVVSQTLWANLATLPPPANTDSVTSKLPVLKPGEFPEGEVHVRDHDSNGWPQTPRTNALRLLRKAQALHIGGDQHLGSTVQYGIDQHSDGPWAICTPAISNIFPRRWYPPEQGGNRPSGAPRYCGEFLDGFGNKVTVHAVSNPVQTGLRPVALFNRATGYGIIQIETRTRKFTLSNWPRQVDATQPGAQPYAGWPVTIHQLDNGFNTARFELKPVDAPAAGMVLQVEDEASREIVYTIRIEGKRITPRVFREGRYTVRLIPDKGRPREFKGLVAAPVRPA